MASSLSQKLWVGIMLVMMVELPGAQEKCIFDEVQSQVRVVKTTPRHHYGPPSETMPSSHTRQEYTHSASLKDGPTQRASPQPALSVTQTKRPLELGLPIPASPQPIRIRTWLPSERPVLSQAEKSRLESAVGEAVALVSSLLSVTRVIGRLLLSRDINKYCKFLWRNASAANYNRCGRANENYRTETCLDVTIPDEHLDGCEVYPDPNSPIRTVLRPEGAGLTHTDFLLYLRVHTTDKCRAELGVLAYAVHCHSDAQGRPLAGVVVICRERLTGETYSHQGTVQTIVHELFHALGFSKQLFSNWRDCSHSPQVAGMGCSPWGQVTNSDGSGQMRIYTQSVISALQKHLASTDPELGGPLENLDVGPSGLSSHWESRVLQGSIMVASLVEPSAVRIDVVTLAALQDTGWYSVNLSQAQDLVWGEGEGAKFGYPSTCQDNSSSFFCIGSGHGCHYLHLHKGECQTDEYLEGCRIYKPLRNQSECWKEENKMQSVEEESRGEMYGIDSRCFFSNLTRESPLIPVSEDQRDSLSSASTVDGRCYRYRCTGPNRYHIQVSGSDWMNCPAGSAIQVQGYRGLVFCPDRRLCQHTDIKSAHNHLSTSPTPSTGGLFASESDSYRTLQTSPSETRSTTHLSNVATSHPTEVTIATVLGITAAVCLLAVVLAMHRKCHSSRVRVQVMSADP